MEGLKFSLTIFVSAFVEKRKYNVFEFVDAIRNERAATQLKIKYRDVAVEENEIIM